MKLEYKIYIKLNLHFVSFLNDMKAAEASWPPSINLKKKRLNEYIKMLKFEME